MREHTDEYTVAVCVADNEKVDLVERKYIKDSWAA